MYNVYYFLFKFYWILISNGFHSFPVFPFCFFQQGGYSIFHFLILKYINENRFLEGRGRVEFKTLTGVFFLCLISHQFHLGYHFAHICLIFQLAQFKQENDESTKKISIFLYSLQFLYYQIKALVEHLWQLQSALFTLITSFVH